MKKKELLKQLIAGFQAGLPVEVYPRELMVPKEEPRKGSIAASAAV